MVRQIDKINDILIQKVTKPDGRTLRYQAVPQSSVGDSSAVRLFATLTAARVACSDLASLLRPVS